MAKRLSKEEAIVRVIGKVNLLKDAESADIEKYMNGYAALRDLEGQEREAAYNDIVFALFGTKLEDEAEEAEEAPMLPAVVETETAITAAGDEAREDAQEEKLEQWLTMAGIVAAVAKEAAQKAAPMAAKAGAWSLCRLVDLYYWLTTYLPIGARWLAVHLIWAMVDSVPIIAARAKAVGRAARAAGLAMAGWGAVIVLAAASLSLRTAEVVADGWRLREEIIAEQAA